MIKNALFFVFVLYVLFVWKVSQNLLQHSNIGITNSMDMSLNKLRESEGQGSLMCSNSCIRNELDTT